MMNFLPVKGGWGIQAEEYSDMINKFDWCVIKYTR